MYRRFFPVPKSPYTLGPVEDICSVHLTPPEKLKDFFSRCIHMLQKVKGDTIGDYLEFGVFNGNSLMSMHEAVTEAGLTNMRLFGFDSFKGLPAGSTNEDDGVWKKGMYSCSFEELQKCVERKNLSTEDITFIQGWYEDTLNADTAKKLQLQNIGIIFVDCDTYSSSKTVLDFIRPLLQQPMIICFDDWKLNDLDIKGLGEYKAFNEFLEKNPDISAQSIQSYNRKSRSFFLTPEDYHSS